MNIDEYRAMIAQSESQKDEDIPVVQEEVNVEPVVEEVKTEENKAINKLVIDGEEIELDKVKEWKRGYMRNDDYTQKTQDLAKQRKEVQEAVSLFENIRSNPELRDEINEKIPIPQSLDPASARVQELENKLYDLMVDREISTLQTKYSDFDAREALEIATSKGLNNLEDAYLLIQANKPKTQDISDSKAIDKSALEKEIRAQIIAEMNAQKDATQSIISTNDNSGSQVVQDVDRLTADELDYCRRSKTDPKEYLKWKNFKR